LTDYLIVLGFAVIYGLASIGIGRAFRHGGPRVALNIAVWVFLIAIVVVIKFTVLS